MFFHFVSDIISLLKQVDKFGKDIVVIDDSCKLGEMPREPLLQSHTKCVDIFIQLLNEGNGLNNWFVLPVYVGGALVSGEAVTKTELGSLDIIVLNLLHDFHEVSSDSSVQLSNGVVEGGGETGLGENSKR